MIGSGKKSNFAGFSGVNSWKNWPILQHFRGNVWGKLRRKSIGKKGRFCGYLLLFQQQDAPEMNQWQSF